MLRLFYFFLIVYFVMTGCMRMTTLEVYRIPRLMNETHTDQTSMSSKLFNESALQKGKIFLQLGHAENITNICYSSDGHYIASRNNSDNIVKVWDIYSGKVVRSFGPKPNTLKILSFCFIKKELFIVSVFSDKKLKVWHANSGKITAALYLSNNEYYDFSEKENFFSKPKKFPKFIFSPDGYKIAAKTLNPKDCFNLSIWDYKTGKRIKLIENVDDEYPICFSLNENTIYSWSNENQTLYQREIYSGKKIKTLSVLSENNDNIINLSISPNGSYIAYVFSSGKCVIKRIDSGKTMFSRRIIWSSSISFSPNSKYFAFNDLYRNAAVVDFKSKTLISGFQGKIFPNSFIKKGVLVTDEYVLSCGRSRFVSYQSNLYLWKINENRGLLKRLNGYAYLPVSIRSINCSSNGKYIISADNDLNVRVWNANTGNLIENITGHDNVVNSVAISSDNETIASGSKDETIKLWSINSGKLIRSINWNSIFEQFLSYFSSKKYYVQSVEFDPDGQKIICSSIHNNTISMCNNIKIWDTNKGKRLIKLNMQNISSTPIFSPDGSLIACASDNVIEIWNANTYKKKDSIDVNITNNKSIKRIKFSHDGKILACVADNLILFFDIKKNKNIGEIHENKGISAICFIHNDKYIIYGSEDYTLKIWEVSSGKHIKTLFGHTDYIASVCISSDGHHLYSGGYDGTIRIWDLFSYKTIVKINTFINNEWLVTKPNSLYYYQTFPRLLGTTNLFFSKYHF